MSRPRKSEARIERKNARALKKREQDARLVEDVKARLAQEPQPRLGANPESIFGRPVRWTCEDPDLEGAWSWGIERKWTEEDWTVRILPRLVEWSRLTWGEIDGFSSDTGHKMHHNMDCGDICDEAIHRLIEIEKLDDTIFRFRLGNLQRLWGFRIVDEFQVLWYDPTHQIYPVGD